MKKITVIVAVVAAGILAAGCNNNRWDDENSITYYRLKTLEEVEDGTATVTTYEWNANGAPSGEVCKRGGEIYYINDNYLYSEDGKTVTCRRTYTEESGEPRIEKYVRVFLDDKYITLVSKERYLVEDGAETLVEREAETYGESMLKRYEHELNGEMVMLHTNFEYNYPYSSFDIAELVEGVIVNKKASRIHFDGSYANLLEEKVTLADTGEEVRYVRYLYDGHNNVYTGYEVKEGERVVERQLSYVSSYDKISYVLLYYDEEGNVARRKEVARTYTKS